MKIGVIILLSLFFLSNVSFGETQVSKILIASSGGAFKKALIARLSEQFKAMGKEVKVITLKELAKQSGKNYDAMVLVNSCWAWRLNRHVNKFLKRMDDGDLNKIILITTAGDPDWKAKVSGVDAITAASKMEELDSLVNQVMTKVSSRQ